MRQVPPAIALAILLSGGPRAAPAVEPLEMMRVDRDLNGDGVVDRFSIRMVSGRRYVDRVLWCGGDGVEKFEGQFEVCVWLSQKRPVCTPLNPLLEDPIRGYNSRGKKVSTQPDIWFPTAEFEINFADYDHDGQIDFNLGRYGGCRGSVYTLLTIEPSGVVIRLLDDPLFLKGVWGTSIAFEVTPTPTGFRCSSWDDSRDGLVCREYARTGSEHQLRFIGERLLGDCPP
jgi:hypothetical protein